MSADQAVWDLESINNQLRNTKFSSAKGFFTVQVAELQLSQGYLPGHKVEPFLAALSGYSRNSGLPECVLLQQNLLPASLQSFVLIFPFEHCETEDGCLAPICFSYLLGEWCQDVMPAGMNLHKDCLLANCQFCG